MSCLGSTQRATHRDTVCVCRYPRQHFLLQILSIVWQAHLWALRGLKVPIHSGSTMEVAQPYTALASYLLA